MVRAVKFYYNSFREKFRLEERRRAEEEYTRYSLFEAHNNASEELLDYFEKWLVENGKFRHKVRVSKFNYIEFLYACKKEFATRASEFVDASHQRAYISGVHRALEAVRLELVELCKKRKREVVDKDKLNLYIIWK